MQVVSSPLVRGAGSSKFRSLKMDCSPHSLRWKESELTKSVSYSIVQVELQYIDECQPLD